MSDEKEIIETLENLVVDKYIDERKLEGKDVEAIINIIILYRQEKEKNKELNEALDEWINGERTSIFHIHKDKIIAKIEELEKDLKEYENGQEWEIQDEIRGQIDVLQSLLEKE